MQINHKHIISVFFFGLLIFVLFQLTRIFSPFLQPFFWALILTFAFYPIYKRLDLLVKNPSLSAALMTLLVVMIAIIPSFIVLERLISQGIGLYNYISGGGLQSQVDALRGSVFLHKYYAFGTQIWDKYLAKLTAGVGPALAGFTTAQIANTTKDLFLVVFDFFVVLFLVFFLFRDGKKIYTGVYELVPLEEKDKVEIFGKATETFESVVRGQFFTSVTQGALCGIVFLILGLPAPYFFGFLTFIATMIPVLGATLVWMPFVIYLFAAQQTFKAVALLLLGVFLISLIDNIIKPILIGGRTKVPVFLLFFGVLGGMKTYGFTGIFLGPLCITIFFALVRIYKMRYGAENV